MEKSEKEKTMDVKIYRISKLVVWSGDTLYTSHKYREVGFTTNEELVYKLIHIRVQDETIWPLREMKGWVMYKCEEIKLIDEYDTCGDFVIDDMLGPYL